MDLIPVSAYGGIARRLGITVSERTLMLNGTLIRITVGRRDHYELADIIAAAPGPAYPLITQRRADLAHLQHTITVERVDRQTARAWAPTYSPELLLGALAVVERSGGRLVKVCAVGPDVWPSAEAAARGTATTYGARYVEVAA